MYGNHRRVSPVRDDEAGLIWLVILAMLVFSLYVFGISDRGANIFGDRHYEVEYFSKCEKKSLTEQAEILFNKFPELSLAEDSLEEYMKYLKEFHEKNVLPLGAKEFILVPNWRVLAPTYSGALNKVLAALVEARGLHNRFGQPNGEIIRQTDRTKEMMGKLAKSQPYGEYLIIVPFQSGMKYRGNSADSVRRVMASNEREFLSGAFTISCFLLTHQDCMAGPKSLWMKCSGDEYRVSACTHFNFISSFVYIDRLELIMEHCCSIWGKEGSPSCFLLSGN